MTDEQLIALLDSSIVEEFELDPAAMTPDAHLFDDLELDSLDIVDLVIVLENVFEFKIREDPALREIRTLGDIHTFVVAKKRQLEATGS